jgi:hypothetical protein
MNDWQRGIDPPGIFKWIDGEWVRERDMVWYGTDAWPMGACEPYEVAAGEFWIRPCPALALEPERYDKKRHDGRWRDPLKVKS